MRWLSAFLARFFGHTPKPSPPPVIVPVLPVARCEFGVVAHRGGAQEIDGIHALGATVVRHGFYTQQDIASPHYRAEFAARLAAWDAIGAEVLVVVHDWPTRNEVPASMADLTRAFPGRHWQVGNEYDAQDWRAVPGSGWGAQGWTNTGTSYARLMQEVVAACPGQRFVGMGLATTDASTAVDDARWTQWTTSYLAAGGPPLVAWCGQAYRDPVTQAAVLARALKGAMPVWLTEFGTDKGDVAQAAVLAGAVAFARGGIRRAYWYDYWDGLGGFGLVDDTDHPRPSFATMQVLLRS